MELEKIQFKHERNQADLRDRHLFTINKESKVIVTEASDLSCYCIVPKLSQDTMERLSSQYIIWLWNEKYQMAMRFISATPVLNGAVVIANRFIPDYNAISRTNGLCANEIQEWELHILND